MYSSLYHIHNIHWIFYVWWNESLYKTATTNTCKMKICCVLIESFKSFYCHVLQNDTKYFERRRSGGGEPLHIWCITMRDTYIQMYDLCWYVINGNDTSRSCLTMRYRTWIILSTMVHTYFHSLVSWNISSWHVMNHMIYMYRNLWHSNTCHIECFPLSSF